MPLETILRLFGAGALIALIAVGGPYRLRAHRAGGAVSRRGEGLALMIGLRAVAAVWGLGFTLWMIEPRWMAWGQVALPSGVRVLGALLIAGSIPLYAWVFHHLGLNLTDTVLVRRQAALVRTGPYRWVRHPLYSFGALFIAGWALMTANVAVTLAGLAAAALIVVRTAIEERHLVERFGTAYREYMATTGRFVPRRRSRVAQLALIVIIVAACTGVPRARADAPDRELSTDRPDRTESAYSVPKGRWQIELDVINHVQFSIPDEGIDGEALALVPFNLKYGIHRRADLQLVVEPWSRTRVTTPGGNESTDQGTGDITGRIKLNLFGNDGGNTALAVMPFVSTPTRGSDRGQIGTYGVVTPFALGLRGDRSFGAMLVVAKDPDLDPWLGGSATVGSPLVGNLAGFVELFAVRAGFDTGAPSDVTADGGLTYALGPDAQLDAGVYVGLSDAAEHWRVFLGFSARR